MTRENYSCESHRAFSTTNTRHNTISPRGPADPLAQYAGSFVRPYAQGQPGPVNSDLVTSDLIMPVDWSPQQLTTKQVLKRHQDDIEVDRSNRRRTFGYEVPKVRELQPKDFTHLR